MIGSQSFEKFRDLDALFVDKSLFIEDFINSPSQVDLILRPRRFSKSLNLSMLKSFFRIGTDPDLFRGLVIFERKIGAEESSSSNENVKTFMEEYCGKYPVLHLNLMHVHGSTWMEILRELWSAVQKMAEEHRSVIDLKYPGEDPFHFNKFFSDPPSEDFVKSSFSNLMQTLCEYHKKKVIVLIDEYDTPFNKTHREVFYAQTMEFLGEFLSSALNGNDALFKACIVGVGEVKMDWMSQCKHMTVHSYLNDKYSPYFGITVEEVRQLGVDEEALKHVMKWYGGYYFGDYQAKSVQYFGLERQAQHICQNS
ncbi:AAA-ATPase-like domain-containing protein [Rozella allomycis CSF55]|uniref:AAA-ATPase-like domain-containing protein n=1 Tax=Rozella allomycis (strain CSF55) TaxID=988480 RepID=A0A075B2B6_ROZAC|nr:AAA-ATPase-like domain-containing protein [Rozella allomycis CSF55]|eukprot:EPZ36730.1 AAA-ATPase-like domain-containing protein [Rozella allomycis CSF55]